MPLVEALLPFLHFCVGAAFLLYLFFRTFSDKLQSETTLNERLSNEKRGFFATIWWLNTSCRQRPTELSVLMRWAALIRRHRGFG